MDTVLGQRTGINYDDINSLKYMDCVIKEVLRLYPPVCSTLRTVPDHFAIGNMEIPAGTTIQVERLSV